MTPDKSFRCGRGQGHVTPVNFGALNAISSKTANGLTKTIFIYHYQMTDELQIWQACSRDSRVVTPDKFPKRWRGQCHVTTTTVPCKLQQLDRYRVSRNVFLFVYACVYVRVCLCKLYFVFVNADACGQEPVKLTASTGTIDSPGYYYGNYSNKANCQWLIEAPAGNVRHTRIRQYRPN